MDDEQFVGFLKWALPKMDLRWEGFRKVYGQVKKRVRDRMVELEIRSLGAYRRRLEEVPEEWEHLEAMSRITISRFYRDAEIFNLLRVDVLPALARRASVADRRSICVWSAGAASGEEPYSIRLCWDLDVASRVADVDLEVVASEASLHMIQRAHRACYPHSTVSELPDPWVDEAFEPRDEELCLEERFRAVEFRHEDVREATFEEPLDLALVRNLVFTYFTSEAQRAFLNGLRADLRDGARLVLGHDERVPDGLPAFEPRDGTPEIVRYRGDVGDDGTAGGSTNESTNWSDETV